MTCIKFRCDVCEGQDSNEVVRARFTSSHCYPTPSSSAQPLHVTHTHTHTHTHAHTHAHSHLYTPHTFNSPCRHDNVRILDVPSGYPSEPEHNTLESEGSQQTHAAVNMRRPMCEGPHSLTIILEQKPRCLATIPSRLTTFSPLTRTCASTWQIACVHVLPFLSKQRARLTRCAA